MPFIPDEPTSTFVPDKPTRRLPTSTFVPDEPAERQIIPIAKEELPEDVPSWLKEKPIGILGVTPFHLTSVAAQKVVGGLSKALQLPANEVSGLIDWYAHAPLEKQKGISSVAKYMYNAIQEGKMPGDVLSELTPAYRRPDFVNALTWTISDFALDPQVIIGLKPTKEGIKEIGRLSETDWKAVFTRTEQKLSAKARLPVEVPLVRPEPRVPLPGERPPTLAEALVPKVEPPITRVKKRGFIKSVKEAEVIAPEVKNLVSGEYAPITNTETWERAKQLVNTDMVKATEKVMGEQLDADYTATALNLIIKAQKEGRISDAVTIAERTAAKLTQGGQFVQAASMLDNLSPEGILVFAQRQFAKSVIPAKAIEITNVTKQVAGRLAQVNEEVVEQVIAKIPEQLKLKLTIPLTPEQKLANKIRVMSIARKTDPVTDMVNTLYRVAQEVLPKKRIPIPRDPMELIGQAIREKEVFREVWTKAQDIVKSKYAGKEEALSLLDDYFGKILEQPFAKKQLIAAVRLGIKEEEINMGQLVRKHYTTVETARMSLTGKLVSEAGIPIEEATGLAKQIEARFNELARAKKESIIKSMFREVKTPQQKTMVERLIEMSNLGALSEDSIRPLVAKKLGIPTLTDELAKKLMEQTEIIQKLPHGYEKFKQSQELMNMINDKLPKTVWHWLGEIANLPRTLMSSFMDLSFGGRQGIFALPSFPKQFGEAFKAQFSMFATEAGYERGMDLVMKNPDFFLAERSGIAFTQLGEVMALREERFMADLAEKIPVIGKGVRMTARAYTGMANKLRMDIFASMAKDAEKLGLNTLDHTKAIANFVNTITGRGSLGQLERTGVLLNAIFFSPRLMSSRLTLLNPFYYIKSGDYARKQALKSLLAFAGMTTTVLGLAKLAGLEVGTEPTSADFGKIKIGNTRIDITGGFIQYIRLAAQLIAGKITSSTTGKEYTLGKGYKPLTKLDIIARALEFKEAPIASFITALLRGQTVMGEKISIPKEVGQRFVPMMASDMYDLYKDDPSLLPLGVLGVFGFGLQTYRPETPQERARRLLELRKEKYKR